MDKSERLKKVINWLVFKGVVEGQNELASLLGYTKSYMSQAVNGHEKLSARFVERLCALDKNLNFDWVFSDSGEMFKNNPFSESDGASPVPPSGSVAVDSDAWAIIKNQAQSLAARDRQVDELISLLREEIGELKKSSVRRDAPAKCADAV